MSNEQSNKLERFRTWSERWNATVSLVLGIIGVPGILIAAYGLWLQYDQLIYAELDTAQQFELMRETLSEMSTQTELQVEINTREASNRFFEYRNNPIYDSLFASLEGIDFETISELELEETEDALTPEFEHFQSTWREVLDCKEPHCELYDMLHSHNIRDICTIASQDSLRLLNIFERQTDFESEEQAYERVQQTVLGLAMCFCPSDWTSWGVETSPYCLKAGKY